MRDSYCRHMFLHPHKAVEITFDLAKELVNISKHGLSLRDFEGFDAEPDVVVDDRFDYGEVRFQARGRINGKGHCLVYVETATGLHLISFRRAHEKEMRRHEQD